MKTLKLIGIFLAATALHALLQLPLALSGIDPDGAWVVLFTGGAALTALFLMWEQSRRMAVLTAEKADLAEHVSFFGDYLEALTPDGQKAFRLLTEVKGVTWPRDLPQDAAIRILTVKNPMISNLEAVLRGDKQLEKDVANAIVRLHALIDHEVKLASMSPRAAPAAAAPAAA